MVNAILIGDRIDALHAAEALDESTSLEFHMRDVLERLRSTRPQRGREDETKDLAMTVGATSSGPAREVAHALAN